MSSVAYDQQRYDQQRSLGLARAGDWLQLTKPKIAVMVLVTVAVSGVLSAGSVADLWRVGHSLLGIALVAASASAFNQWLERDRDRRMARTADRPLPSGRIASGEVVVVGAALVVSGIGYLLWQVNAAAAALALLTWALYVWVYTPLKSRTPSNTVVGAVAGALPVLMGAAAGGQIGMGAVALFVLVYMWQFPHFMAIAWMYRRDYSAAGLTMLPVVDSSGARAGRLAVRAAAALLPVSLLPALFYPADWPYVAVALAVGTLQLSLAVRFSHRLDDESARALLRASLIYLPSVLLFLLVGPAW